MSCYGGYCKCDSCKNLLSKWSDLIPEGVKLIEMKPFTNEEKKCVEIHADGIKEIKCNSCSEPCGNDWCCMKDEQ